MCIRDSRNLEQLLVVELHAEGIRQRLPDLPAAAAKLSPDGHDHPFRHDNRSFPAHFTQAVRIAFAVLLLYAFRGDFSTFGDPGGQIFRPRPPVFHGRAAAKIKKRR